MMEDKIKAGVVERIGNYHQASTEKGPEKGHKTAPEGTRNGQVVAGYFSRKDVIEKRVADVLALLAENPQITQYQMAETLGLSRKQIRTALDQIDSERSAAFLDDGNKSLSNDGDCDGNYDGNGHSMLLSRIIDLLRINPKNSAVSLAAATGKSKPTIERCLKELKEIGRIRRNGSTRGFWVVLK